MSKSNPVVGDRVKYESHKGVRAGSGTIVAVSSTARGVWYRIEDKADGYQISLRISGFRVV